MRYIIPKHAWFMYIFLYYKYWRHGMDGARPTAVSSGMLGGAISSPRSISMASISSEGSMESPIVEQEEIAALTHDVRNFKEALGKLRKIFHLDWTDRGKFVWSKNSSVFSLCIILCQYYCLSHRPKNNG